MKEYKVFTTVSLVNEYTIMANDVDEAHDLIKEMTKNKTIFGSDLKNKSTKYILAESMDNEGYFYDKKIKELKEKELLIFKEEE